MLPMLNLGDEKFVRHKLGFAPRSPQAARGHDDNVVIVKTA
jgi:hypothetical protein